MRVEEVKVYEFSELSKEAKEHALEKLRDINVNYQDWHDFTLDEWKENLNKMGFYDVKIYYSGFWSQGDGACFIGNLDLETYLENIKRKTKFKKLIELKDYINISITHNHRYYFSTSTNINIEFYDEETKEISDLLADLEEILKNHREELGNQIYKDLEESYIYLTSDEAVIETIEANDYEFTSDGEIY